MKHSKSPIYTNIYRSPGLNSGGAAAMVLRSNAQFTSHAMNSRRHQRHTPSFLDFMSISFHISLT